MPDRDESAPVQDARTAAADDVEIAATAGEEPAGADEWDLADPGLYLNRELSWLEFNRRVLAQAIDSDTPLLERVRFVSIFASNLDEFFMIRVGGLHRQVAAGVTRRTPDGRTPSGHLSAIAGRLRPMLESASDCLHGQLLPLLEREGINLVAVDELDADHRDALVAWFDEQVFPVLTPLAVDPGHPFPYISNLSLSLAVTVQDRKTGEEHFARVKVPKVLPRFVQVPGRDDAFVPLEELIAEHLDRLFPGMEVIEAYPFRITRNADFDIEEEEADDLLLAIEQEVRKRRFGAVVRLEVAAAMTERILGLLQDELDVGDIGTYRTEGLIGLEDLHEIADLDRPELRWVPWKPVAPARLSETTDVFAEIRRGDLLVHHPYDSFAASVERFITAAADDPKVLAIKQTLYRTSGDSPIVRALIRAAESGKQVVALVELKARFDEEANILWARQLEKVGVHVVYGLVGLKTHSKVSLVVRRERQGLRRYVHVGTGNYNPRTARLYTDIGLFTSDPNIGADATDLFNFLTGYARQDTYRELIVAPVSLRERIVEMIHREIAAHREHGRGLIRAKVNSLIDSDLIRELYAASQAGVRVELVIRGICGLRPGIPGLSDRMRVISVVGRFLEHARIMQFGDDVWIGSADWMGRNLDRRVEVMVPVREPELRAELTGALDLMLDDNVLGWRLAADGSWHRRHPLDGEQLVNSQAELMRRAAQRAGEAERRGGASDARDAPQHPMRPPPEPPSGQRTLADRLRRLGARPRRTR